MKEDMLKRNEEAVSPVIGEILMVAIVVILAAVVAAYVFGMTPPKMAPDLHFTNVVAIADGDPLTVDTVKMTVVGTAVISTGDLRCVVNDVIDTTPTIIADDGDGQLEAGEGLSLNPVNFAVGDNVHIVITHIPSGNLILDQPVIARSE